MGNTLQCPHKNWVVFFRVFNIHWYFHSWILDLVPLWNTMPIYLLLAQNCFLETDIIDLFVKYWIFSCIHVCKSICSLWQYDSSKQLETPFESRNRKRRWTARWMTAADLLPFFFWVLWSFWKKGTVEPYLPFISTLIRSSFLWNKNHCLIKRHIGQTAAKCYFHRIFTPWWGNFEQRCLSCTFWSPDLLGVPKNARRFRLCSLAQERRNRHFRCLSTDGESQRSLVWKNPGGWVRVRIAWLKPDWTKNNWAIGWKWGKYG